MASKPHKSASAGKAGDRPPQPGSTALSLPPAEVRSFLKETRGSAGWGVADLAKTLNLSAAVAKEVITFLEAQGYIEPSGRNEWLTTAAGDAVSGSKPPRFTPESAEAALSELADGIKGVNQDRDAPFQITAAVAFGDFFSGRARVQAPDVGIQLTPRGPGADDPESAVAQAARRNFLRQLKGKRPILSVRPYEEWMSSRAHRTLV
jgi:hypothetical protein